MADSGPHDEFLELCALSVSGELNREERDRLEAHLAQCPSCRRAQQEYAAIVDHGLPKIAAELGSSFHSDSSSSFSTESEAEFFRRLQVEAPVIEDPADLERRDEQHTEEDPKPGSEEQDLLERERISLAALDNTWRSVWTLYAAGIVLLIALGFSAYQIGARRETPQKQSSPTLASNPSSLRDTDRLRLEQQLSDTGHQLELDRAQIAQRDRSIADLRRRLDLQSSELAKATEALADERKEASVPKFGQEVGRTDTLAKQQLQSAEAEAQSLRAQIAALQTKSTEESNRATQLQAMVTDLTRELQDREAETDQQRELLAHDRDIRDLMGARDLYIAEVYDVAGSGKTRKPYGRLFYTKEKSLVFYAYDLDQQPGLKNANTFQAWGRRGPNRERALNLGIFYQDNAAKKRWVLKFNDPKTLSQIDAVFVTVEPNGGSSKPSTNPLLFAYLRVEPNHP